MKTVAVFSNQNASSSVDLYRGLVRFARTRNDWTLWDMGSVRVTKRLVVPALKADGVLLTTALADRSALAALVKRRMPVVNLLQAPPPLMFPAVSPDNQAAGRLGGEHLLGLGLRRFGYLQFAAGHDNAFRLAGFTTALHSAGGACAVNEISSLWGGVVRRTAIHAVARWIRSIGCPCGILAFNDSLGSPFIRAVRAAGFRVPEDVAVVGIDDHDVLCEFCDPPMSSVNLNNQVIGYEAAALLDRLMRSGRPGPAMQTLIPPIGVIERRSSQMLAVENDVARVLRLMHRHLGERLTVRKMATEIHVSTRALEMKFQNCLGRSPSEEMTRLRLEHAKRLLIDTEKSIVVIAEDTGFANTGHFCRTFKAKTEMTPGEYRRSVRGDVRDR